MGVDLSASIYSEYKRACRKAEEAEKLGAYSEAARAYQQAAQWMRQYATCSHDLNLRKQRQQKALSLERLSDKLQALPSRPAPVIKREYSEENQEDFEGIILGLKQKTHIRWEDIGGLEETKNTIKIAYGLAIARKPAGVQIAPLRNLLLFGAPGTGKTLLAAATAGSLDANFFNVSVGDLLSKYFGESTKLISALFNVARQQSPSVIFLDEFESLMANRDSSDSGAERRVVSQFLAELDGLDTKENKAFVLTIAATNLPWLLDKAIFSRFQQRIYIPLPDETARRAILEIMLTRRGHRSILPLPELAKRTAGFSGREIEQLCQIAITNMVQRVNPKLLHIVDGEQSALASYEIKVEPISRNDFEIALKQVKPLATAEMLQTYQDWIQRTVNE